MSVPVYEIWGVAQCGIRPLLDSDCEFASVATSLWGSF